MTDVEICNAALASIGGLPIVSIGEATVNGELCKRFYQITYDKSLRQHNWKCATVRAQLAAVTAPVFEWDFAYALPADPFCLRVIQTELPEYEWTVEGRTLLSDQGTAKIKYIGRVPTGQLDPLCTKFIYHNLAIELAFSVSGDLNLKNVLYEELVRNILPECTQADAIEEMVPDFDKLKSGWLDSRLSGVTTLSTRHLL